MDFAGYINGAFVKGEGATLEVENPSTGAIFSSFKGASAGQIQSAIGAARRAFDSGVWSDLPRAERVAKLRRFSKALNSRSRQLTEIIVQEAGCPPHSGAMHAQVATPLKQIDEIIDLALAVPEIEENPLPLSHRVLARGGFAQSLRRYVPVGVVAAIAAYNFPFFTAMWKVIPALVTGNTVVLRPNPLTPLSAMIFAEAAQEAELPPGVLNVVLDAGVEGGQLLSTDPAVDMVGFTGSSNVGALVMAQGAATMKRVQLELGGKSAAIYLPDAVDSAKMAGLIICMSHAGQGCTLATRIFVPQDRKDEVVAAMAESMSRMVVGPADDPKTQMGPVISAAQEARCARYVKLAVENGAKLVTGGKRPAHLAKGNYFEPTLLDVPDNKNPAAQDEIFGPVAVVIGYRDVDHAVEMANDSQFGLAGYVYGKDSQAALNVAMRLRAGQVDINGGTMSSYIAFGGRRMSGIGYERGVEGLRAYQHVTSLGLVS